MDNLAGLINKLCKISNENRWLEFKLNNSNEDMIGQNISALANGAAYDDKDTAYMLWGIDDATHEIIGTKLTLDSFKVGKSGKQELESWLREMLSKNTDFEFDETLIDEKRVIVAKINRAIHTPVSFKKIEYIRVGSYTKKLNEYPSMQTKLWDKVRQIRNEDMIVKKNLSAKEALSYLDYSAYFDLINDNQVLEEDGILFYMIQEGIIIKDVDGTYGITNLGALLFAKKLSDFPNIARKSVRVAKYDGNNKLDLLKQNTGTKGYAVGFEGLLQYIEALVPTTEHINGALREKKSAYPLIAIREAIANALIHQDFSITGAGPLVEIFDNRMEITNPGIPLIDISRIIDNPPRSRNEKIASLMRRLRICEELGSGWDKIALSCEAEKLPAPKIIIYEESTKVIFYSKTSFSNLSQEDKLWTCYLHACIKYVSGDVLTNSTLRERFGLEASSSASISRLIKDATVEGLVKPIDPDTAPRYMKYVPAWA